MGRSVPQSDCMPAACMWPLQRRCSRAVCKARYRCRTDRSSSLFRAFHVDQCVDMNTDTNADKKEHDKNAIGSMTSHVGRFGLRPAKHPFCKEKKFDPAHMRSTESSAIFLVARGFKGWSRSPSAISEMVTPKVIMRKIIKNKNYRINQSRFNMSVFSFSGGESPPFFRHVFINVVHDSRRHRSSTLPRQLLRDILSAVPAQNPGVVTRAESGLRRKYSA